MEVGVEYIPPGESGNAMRFLMIFLASISAIARGAMQEPAVAVITNNEVEAYAQALEGIREVLPNVQVWDARDEERLRENLTRKAPALAIALGSGAAAALGRVAPHELTLVTGVVLESNLGSDSNLSSRFRTAVTVDLPPEVLLKEIAELFPGRTRIGVIRGPMQTDANMTAFERAARRIGFAVEVAICQYPRDVVEVFLKLKSRADLVWCPPNAQLYNSATLKPLLIASLTRRLPIIGFSEQFVQAGALVGGFADFVEVGRQTAALALRLVRNEAVPSRQEARKFRFAYNQRVARMLGVRSAAGERPDSELLLIR